MSRQITWSYTKANCKKYNLPYIAEGGKEIRYYMDVYQPNKDGSRKKLYTCVCVASTSKDAIDSIRKDCDIPNVEIRVTSKEKVC